MRPPALRAVTALTGLVLLAPALAGCLAAVGPGSGAGTAAGELPPIPDDWAARVLPFGEGHDHRDPAQHANLSTSNFELLGYEPLVSDHYGETSGGHLCGSAKDTGERDLAVVHSYDSDVAFVLVDVTDPTAPEVLGELVLPATGSRDVDVTADGRHVVIAVSAPQQPDQPVQAADGLPAVGTGATGPLSDTTKDDPAAGPHWRSACDGSVVPVEDRSGLDRGPEQNVPYPPGAMLVDISDPANPAIADHLPLPVLGAHSIYAGEVNNETVVIASVVNLVAAVSNFYFLGVQDTPLGDRWELLSVYQDPAYAENAPLINGHNDGVIQEHPITGQTLAYLANWHQGIILLDVTDPRSPTVVGRWSDNPDPNADLVSDGTGNYHEAIPIEGLWDGRHYTFIGQEIGSHPSGTPTGWMRALDTTDPANPRKTADWTLPVDVQWDESFQFSTHYISIADRTVFMSLYHGGVWAVDASDVGNRSLLPSVGAFLPARTSPHPYDTEGRSFTWAPTVLEANALPDGTLTVWDGTSGLYTVRFDADRPAPPMEPLLLGG